ncbi:MAG: DnaJ domain-containing protein, partial [Myxococcaceae bacterium]|nr:DnaJ domain-containing protein [Myxococcaceae bacterium]
RLAEERRRAEEEARLAEERRRAEEEARLAEERRRAEEELRLAEERRRAEEEARIAADREALLNATMDEGWITGTPDVEATQPLQLAKVADAAAVSDRDNLAKHREQSDLLRELNEALRRSVSSATIEAEEPSVVVDVDKTAPNLELPKEVKGLKPIHLAATQVSAAPASAVPKPLILGPQSAVADSGDGDLWKIVEPSAVEVVQTTSNSFEEALQRVDSDLEALVAQATDEGVWDTPVVEATVETVVEPETATEEIRLSEEDLADDPSDSAEAARQRRQRLLRRAMENLGTIPQRPEMQGAVPVSPTPAPAGRTLTPAPVGRTATPPPVGRAATPAPVGKTATPPPAGGADQQVADQIEKRYEALQKNRELYAVLGLPVGAPKDQVKQAFLSLAKIYHPDRLPSTLPHLAPKMNSLFEAIRDAYEQLYDDAKRASYMSAMASGKAPGAPVAKPAAAGSNPDDLARMGEVFFKKRDYRQAEDHFAKAHALDNKANSLAARAWAIYSDPTRKAEIGSAKQMMTQALKLDPNCDRAHYQLGVIARVEGEVDRAEKHFREAVRINAKHLEANQELRLIEMRKKKDGKGFFR